MDWKQFNIIDIFDIHSGKQLPAGYIKSGNIASISASTNNNGCDKFITPPDNFIIRNNMITIAGDGEGLGSCFYHPYNFTNTGFTKTLELKDKSLNKYIALFLCSSLEKLKDKYSYGMKLSKGRLEKESIWLPVTDDGNIDWEYMENKVKHAVSEYVKSEIEYIEYIRSKYGVE